MSAEQGALNPIELNAQLKQCYDSIPRYPLFDPSFDRRKLNSEYALKFTEKVRDLIVQAPISLSFRRRIEKNFEDSFTGGIDPGVEPKIMNEEFSFFEGYSSQDGGIFDPARAKILERRAFIRQVGANVAFGEVTTGLEESHRKEGYERGARVFGRMLDEERNLTEQWKADFEELYGEEIIVA